MWYVVQTLKGQESKAAQEIKAIVLEENEEAFTLESERMFRIKGKWIKDSKPLFPGYLFVITDSPNAFDERLRAKCRRHLLRVDDEITPIRSDEENYLSILGGKEHIVRFSEGYRRGDKVQIESGALAGFTGEIKKLDRHNRQAVISLSLFGRKTDVTLGLGIVRAV